MVLSPIRSVKLSLGFVCVAVRALIYARRSDRFRRELAKLCDSAASIDVNLAEIRRMRKDWVQKSDEAIAGSVRRDFDGVDVVALADYLQLEPESLSRRGKMT